MKYVDLHTHSTSSDGTFTPSELAAYAARKGLAAFALTDHDTTDGLAEAEAAAAEHGIEFVPGIEFSTDYDGHDIHIVGLDIDRTQKELTERLQAFRQNRDARNEEMLELLRTVGGFAITMEDLRRSYGQDTVITRAHFGRWLFEHGCVKSISEAVSYTHLDVYKRQYHDRLIHLIGYDDTGSCLAMASFFHFSALLTLDRRRRL